MLCVVTQTGTLPRPRTAERLRLHSRAERRNEYKGIIYGHILNKLLFALSHDQFLLSIYHLIDMTAQEGVIKYTLNHQYAAINEAISIAEINSWRTLMHKLELIGQIKERYQGYGFGNISQRVNHPENTRFLISGTQTGHLTSLSRQHYCLVLDAYPEKNSLHSLGETKPSSEALTHAIIYRLNQSIQSIIHIHCPELWRHTKPLQLAYTDSEVEYGTPEMAYEVQRLFQQHSLKQQGIFSMLGHEDGVIAFAATMEQAALQIIKYYRLAIQLEQKKRDS